MIVSFIKGLLGWIFGSLFVTLIFGSLLWLVLAIIGSVAFTAASWLGFIRFGLLLVLIAAGFLRLYAVGARNDSYF